MTPEITVTRRLAPEDIIPGIFIAITARTHEIFPYWLISGTPGTTVDVVAFSCRTCADGNPLRVLATCLPFVMTESARGAVEVLDTRACAIVQVDEMFALELFTRPARTPCPCCE